MSGNDLAQATARESAARLDEERDFEPARLIAQQRFR